MFKTVINLPFKVLSGVARAVQAQEARRLGKRSVDGDASAVSADPSVDISVPDDFDPGPIDIAPTVALALLKDGCVLDASQGRGQIPGALHIPWSEIGIRIAELPPDTTVAVISADPTHSVRVVRFLRHRGLDETWSLTGGLDAWIQAGGPTGETEQ